MAEGATPAERTTGGKEAPSPNTVRQEAVQRLSPNQQQEGRSERSRGTRLGNPKAKAANYNPPGVERGVSGKERRYQQNRAFGQGPIKPYPYGPGGTRYPNRYAPQYGKPRGPHPIPSGRYPKNYNSRGVHQNPEVV